MKEKITAVLESMGRSLRKHAALPWVSVFYGMAFGVINRYNPMSVFELSGMGLAWFGISCALVVYWMWCWICTDSEDLYKEKEVNE